MWLIYYGFKGDMCICGNVIIIGGHVAIRHPTMSISPFFIFRFMRECERCPRGIIIILAIRISCGISCALVKRWFPVSRPVKVNLASRAFTYISLAARREKQKIAPRRLRETFSRVFFLSQATKHCVVSYSLFLVEITSIFFFFFLLATRWSELIFFCINCVLKLVSHQFTASRT